MRRPDIKYWPVWLVIDWIVPHDSEETPDTQQAAPVEREIYKPGF
jgi:hypothetical protein